MSNRAFRRAKRFPWIKKLRNTQPRGRNYPSRRETLSVTCDTTRNRNLDCKGLIADTTRARRIYHVLPRCILQQHSALIPFARLGSGQVLHNDGGNELSTELYSIGGVTCARNNFGGYIFLFRKTAKFWMLHFVERKRETLRKFEAR